jgi:CheY-like chemotaxis protein
MSTIRKYILVDDDPFNNILNGIMIEDALGDVEINTFEVPEDALAFIHNEYRTSEIPAVLFLDLNMPSLTGWEFMEEFEKFGEKVKEQISIYILSSSIDPRDKAKAEANRCIKGFISKSLQREVILSIAGV